MNSQQGIKKEDLLPVLYLSSILGTTGMCSFVGNLATHLFAFVWHGNGHLVVGYPDIELPLHTLLLGEVSFLFEKKVCERND